MTNEPIKLINGQSYDWTYYSFKNALGNIIPNLTAYSIKLIATNDKGVDYTWTKEDDDFILAPGDPSKFRSNLTVEKVAAFPFARAYYYMFVITPSGSSIPFLTGTITKKS